MSDHLEDAAARALRIVSDLRDPETSEMRIVAQNDAQEHLAYLAGLIRGGAATGTIPAREILRGRLSAQVASGGIIANERAARRRAEADLALVRAEWNAAREQRDELRDAVKTLLAYDSVQRLAPQRVLDLVARIERLRETPAEGARRLHVE